MAKHYSVYERTTDKPIVIYGTPEECAKALGITRDSFCKGEERNTANQEV